MLYLCQINMFKCQMSNAPPPQTRPRYLFTCDEKAIWVSHLCAQRHVSMRFRDNVKIPAPACSGPTKQCLLQSTPVYSSLLASTPVYSSLLASTPVYSSLLPSTPVYFSTRGFRVPKWVKMGRERVNSSIPIFKFLV